MAIYSLRGSVHRTKVIVTTLTIMVGACAIGFAGDPAPAEPKPVVLNDFTGKGFDQYFDTWKGGATTKPTSLVIAGGSNGVAESYPGSVDLGKADTIRIVGRALPGNTDGGIIIRLRDADGTVYSWSIGMKEFEGDDFKTVSRPLGKPTSVVSPGTTPGLDLANIAAYTLTGSYSGPTKKFMFEIARIEAIQASH